MLSALTCEARTAYLLWIGEVVVDLLVEDVEYDVEEVPAEALGQVAMFRQVTKK